MTQAEQNAMFKAVAAKYTAGPLFIKTHPRDTTDYHALFPDAVILERTMPSEVLNFCLPSNSPAPSQSKALCFVRLLRRMRRSFSP